MPSTFGLLFLGLWFGTRNLDARANSQKAIINVVFSLVLVTLLVHITYFFYHKPRPFMAHEVNLLIPRPTDPSFPSNSSAVSFAMAASIWFINRPLGSLLFIPASLVALSRVFMGVHYPVDVLGGAAYGFLSSFMSWYFLRRFRIIPDSIITIARKLLLA